MTNIQSLASGLQQVMEDNKTLRDEMQNIMSKDTEHVKGQGMKRKADDDLPETYPTIPVSRPLFVSPQAPKQNPGETGGDHGQRAKPEKEPEVPPRAKFLDQFDVDEDLKDIDKKDVALPSKYKGDTHQWRHWSTKSHTFLMRRDAR